MKVLFLLLLVTHTALAQTSTNRALVAIDKQIAILSQIRDNHTAQVRYWDDQVRNKVNAGMGATAERQKYREAQDAGPGRE